MKRLSDKTLMTVLVLFNVTMFTLGLVFNNAAFIGALLPINILIAVALEEQHL